FESRTPVFVDRKTCAGDFRGGAKIQNSGALTHIPVRLRCEIKLWRRSPAADLDVFGTAMADGNGGVWHVRQREQKLALGGVELRDAFIAPLDALGNLFHFGNQLVGVL